MFSRGDKTMPRVRRFLENADLWTEKGERENLMDFFSFPSLAE